MPSVPTSARPIILALATWCLGCSGDGGEVDPFGDTDGCLPGREGCPCNDDGSCEETLSCEQGTCVADPLCGNAMPDDGEECDDGNAINTDACLDTCMMATCGDGQVWDMMEACDDGNTDNSDDCLDTCTAAACGDGEVHAELEECDDGNEVDGDACTSSCTAAACGDGVVWDIMEACDDGNRFNGDGCNVDCVASGTPLWTKTLDVGADDIGNGIAVDGSGNLVVVGTVTAPGQGTDLYVAKLDPEGRELWSRTYNDPADGDDAGNGIAVDSGSNIVVVGVEDRTDLVQGQNIFVRKYDPDGTELWTQTHNGLSDSNDIGWDVAVDSADSAIVVGFETRTDLMESTNAWARKYDTGGATIWTQTYNNTSNSADSATGVAVGARDVVAVVGWESRADMMQDRNVWLRLYSANGVTAWTRTYNGPDDDRDEGQDVAFDSDGNVLATGFVRAAGQSENVWVGKFDAEGAVVWQEDFHTGQMASDRGYGIVTELDQSIVVAEAPGSGEGNNLYLQRTNGAGMSLWTQSLDGGRAEDDGGRALVLVDDNAVAAVGFATIGNGTDILIAKAAR